MYVGGTVMDPGGDDDPGSLPNVNRSPLRTLNQW